MYQISQCKDNKNVALLHSLKHEIALSNNLKTDAYNTKRHVVFPIRFFLFIPILEHFFLASHQTHQPF